MIIVKKKKKDGNSLTSFISRGILAASFWSSHEQRKGPEIWQQGKPFGKDTP